MRVFSCCQQIGHSLFPPQSLYFYCYCRLLQVFFPSPSLVLLVYESGIHFRMKQLLNCWSCSLFSDTASPFDPQKVSRSNIQIYGQEIGFSLDPVLHSSLDPQVRISLLSPSDPTAVDRDDGRIWYQHLAAAVRLLRLLCAAAHILLLVRRPQRLQDLLLHKTNRVMQYICIRSFMCHPS